MSQPFDESATSLDPTKTPQPPQQPTSMAENPSARRRTLGEHLRVARYAAHLTQEDLAGGTFSKSYISAVERGKMTPSISALRLLAERLEVSLAYLLGEEEVNLSPEHAGSLESGQKHPPDEAQLVRQLDEARQLLLQGESAAALEWLGIQEAARELSSAHRARWHWLYGWALLQQQQIEQAIATLEVGLQAALESQDHRAAGLLYLMLARANAARHEDKAAERAFQEAIHTTRQISDYKLLSHMEEQYGMFLAERSRYQEAYEHMRLAQVALLHTESDH